jgi:hypothetical protein
VQPVHDGLDDLQQRERDDAIVDHGADDASILHLGR